MKTYSIHTVATAPEASKPTLQALEKKFGFLPNLMGTMAGSPVLLNGFFAGFGSFHGGSFDEAEKQILLLTNAVTLGAPWTIAAHSTFALEDGIGESDVAAIREGGLPADPRFAALSAMTRALIEKRGAVTLTEIDAFMLAGYSEVQILEVVTGIGISTMAATTTNLARTPVEPRFQPQVWAAA